jgi:predicted negative regulator of RcsB-dependent stress response
VVLARRARALAWNLPGSYPARLTKCMRWDSFTRFSARRTPGVRLSFFSVNPGAGPAAPPSLLRGTRMASSTVARSRQANTKLDSDDALAIRAAELSAWARRNARMIMAIAAVALVVVGGLVVWKYSQAQRRVAAAERLLALNANPAVMTAAGTRELEQFITQYDGTPEAVEARLMLAQSLMDQGQPRRALPHLQQVADGGSLLAAQAAMMLGSAHSQLGDRNAAIRAYQQAAEKAKMKYQRFEALGQAAVQHEASGNWRGAADIYRGLLAESEKGSQQATVIEMRMTEALARAGTPAR